MAYKDYVGWEPEDWLPHIEDELRKDTQMYCSNSFLGARPVTTPTGLQIGDTVKIVGEELAGQVGEVNAVDEDVYGVWLDTVGQEMFFCREEIKRVEPEQALFDEAVARAQALGRPFEDKEVFGFIWEQGLELVPQMDSRFILVREATGKTRRLWCVVNEAELPF